MKKKKILKILYIILAVIFVSSAIVTTAMILSFDKDYSCPKFGNYIIVSVNNSELSPKVLKGSALISDLEYNEVNRGDYIVIASKGSDGFQYAARLVEEVEDEYYTVSGTQNRGAFYVAKDSVIAVNRMQIYGLGGFINMMRTQSGFFIFVIIPLVVIIMIQIVRMVLLIQEKKIKEKYEAEKKKINDSDKSDEVSS